MYIISPQVEKSRLPLTGLKNLFNPFQLFFGVFVGRTADRKYGLHFSVVTHKKVKVNGGVAENRTRVLESQAYVYGAMAFHR